MPALHELARFMLIRPPEDASAENAPVTEETPFQDSLIAAADAGDVTRMRELAEEFARSPSFVQSISDLKSGTPLVAFMSKISAATDPTVAQVKSWITDAFGTDAKSLVRQESPGGGSNSGHQLAFKKESIVANDVDRLSDSLIAIKILSNGRLANVEVLTSALQSLLLIRRIGTEDVALFGDGAVRRALTSKLMIREGVLPLAAMRNAPVKEGVLRPPPKADRCQKRRQLVEKLDDFSEALDRLRELTNADLDCPCEPVRHPSSVDARAAGMLAELPHHMQTMRQFPTTTAFVPTEWEGTTTRQPGTTPPPKQRKASKSPIPGGPPDCPPNVEGPPPCPPPFLVRKEVIERLGAGVHDVLAQLKIELSRTPLPTAAIRVERAVAGLARQLAEHDSDVLLRIRLVGGKMVVVCDKPRDAKKDCCNG